MNAVLRPAVPVVDMQVGAADRGDVYFDQHVGAPEAGNLNFANLRAWLGFRLDYCKHSIGHERRLSWRQKTLTTEVTEDTEDSSTRSAPAVCYWPARGPEGPGFRSVMSLTHGIADEPRRSWRHRKPVARECSEETANARTGNPQCAC